jgi:ATP-binding cassette subfamily F protein 3
MDMRSKDILKDALQKFDGTVVVVSHDREFLDGLVDRIYEFRDGGVREYLGDIWYFLEKRKVESLQEIERKDRPTQSEKSNDTPTAGKMTYEQKKEQEKILRKLRKAVESVEEELAKVESEIAEYDKRFAVSTEYNAEDYAKYDTLKQHYDHLMHEWEKASYELEITEQN